ncbi:MAG TPA: hypothetical protein VGH85_01280 [Mycobacteriales bacterium]
MSHTVTILGAGAMGTALTTPALAGGHRVRLWGTSLDTDILAVIRRDEQHPRLGLRVDRAVATYSAEDLPDALEGADLVVLAISSDGALDIAGQAADHLRAGTPVLVTTKGFGRDGDGAVALFPPLLREVIGADIPLIVAGGPCKANEVAAGDPTATTYASDESAALRRVASMLATDSYRIEPSSDVVGVEITAAMKNVYAIALGICDGLGDAAGSPRHNLKSAVFARALREMRSLSDALGGDPATVYGLPGAGDLEVTGLSGRNKVYGARIGAGERPRAALTVMHRAGQTVEGAAALPLAAELGTALQATDRLAPDALPLLAALGRILDDGVDPQHTLAEASLPGRSQVSAPA